MFRTRRSFKRVWRDQYFHMFLPFILKWITVLTYPKYNMAGFIQTVFHKTKKIAVFVLITQKQQYTFQYFPIFLNNTANIP